MRRSSRLLLVLRSRPSLRPLQTRLHRDAFRRGRSGGIGLVFHQGLRQLDRPAPPPLFSQPYGEAVPAVRRSPRRHRGPRRRAEGPARRPLHVVPEPIRARAARPRGRRGRRAAASRRAAGGGRRRPASASPSLRPRERPRHRRDRLLLQRPSVTASSSASVTVVRRGTSRPQNAAAASRRAASPQTRSISKSGFDPRLHRVGTAGSEAACGPRPVGLPPEHRLHVRRPGLRHLADPPGAVHPVVFRAAQGDEQRVERRVAGAPGTSGSAVTSMSPPGRCAIRMSSSDSETTTSRSDPATRRLSAGEDPRRRRPRVQREGREARQGAYRIPCSPGGDPKRGGADAASPPCRRLASEGEAARTPPPQPPTPSTRGKCLLPSPPREPEQSLFKVGEPRLQVEPVQLKQAVAQKPGASTTLPRARACQQRAGSDRRGSSREISRPGCREIRRWSRRSAHRVPASAATSRARRTTGGGPPGGGCGRSPD